MALINDGGMEGVVVEPGLSERQAVWESTEIFEPVKVAGVMVSPDDNVILITPITPIGRIEGKIVGLFAITHFKAGESKSVEITDVNILVMTKTGLVPVSVSTVTSARVIQGRTLLVPV